MTFKLTALISFPQMPVSDSLSAVHDCSRLNKGYNTFGIDRTAVDTDFKMQVTSLCAFADRRVADAANDLTGGDSVADIHGRLSLQIGVNACHAVCVRDDDCDPESVVNRPQLHGLHCPCCILCQLRDASSIDEASPNKAES